MDLSEFEGGLLEINPSRSKREHKSKINMYNVSLIIDEYVSIVSESIKTIR